MDDTPRHLPGGFAFPEKPRCGRCGTDHHALMPDASSLPEELVAFRVLRELMAGADQAGLQLVPIRDRPIDQATALSGGDYDLLLPAATHDEFMRLLLGLASAAAISFTVDQTNPVKKRIALHVPERQCDLVIELWSHLEVRDPARATARSIAWESIAPLLVRVESGWRMPPAIEALYYLSHLATRRKSVEHAEVRRRLSVYRTSCTDVDVLGLIERAQQGDAIDTIAGLANRRMIELGILAPCTGFPATIRAWRTSMYERRTRHRRRAIVRGGVFAFTGPDGVGKTTVITALCSDLVSRAVPYRFKSLFRHNPLYQILHGLRFKAVAKQHGGELAKNLFDELHAPALFRIARIGHPWLHLRARLGAYRCCDRYYHELLFADLRKLGAQPRLHDGWQNMARRMPMPAWHVQLDAANEVILARKQELSPQSLECYRNGLFTIHLAINTPYYTYLNTGCPIDDVRTVLRLAGAPIGLRFRS